MAIRAVASGKRMAENIHSFLQHTLLSNPESFFCRVGTLGKDELQTLLNLASQAPRILYSAEKGYGVEEAIVESQRCLHCDCRSLETCKLRAYALEYQIKPKVYTLPTRPKIWQIQDHPEAILEPNKCIRCGLCVRMAQKQGESIGLALIGRSDQLQIAVPFEHPLTLGLTKATLACANVCPVGALQPKSKHVAQQRALENRETVG